MNLKFLILTLLFIIVCLIYSFFKFNIDGYLNDEKRLKDSKILKKNKVLHRCNLIEEIIDREFRDSERQCFYDCGEKNIKRVDTSIEYPCQNYILEKK